MRLSKNGFKTSDGVLKSLLFNVLYLFSDLFEFRFHMDNPMGHFGVADFGAHGVEFPIQLLQQKI